MIHKKDSHVSKWSGVHTESEIPSPEQALGAWSKNPSMIWMTPLDAWISSVVRLASPIMLICPCYKKEQILSYSKNYKMQLQKGIKLMHGSKQGINSHKLELC